MELLEVCKAHSYSTSPSGVSNVFHLELKFITSSIQGLQPDFCYLMQSLELPLTLYLVN